MDSSPVSAFAVYKSTKRIKPQNKKKKKRTQVSEIPHGSKNYKLLCPFSATLMKQGVDKVKNKFREEKDKNAKRLGIKRKSPKKKKLRTAKERNTFTKSLDEPQDRRNSKHKQSSTEIVPTLVQIRNSYTPFENSLELSSNSSSASMPGFEYKPVQTDSSKEALKAFQWMIAPYNNDEFFNRIWEKKPLHIARQKPFYYKDLISTPGIDNMLRNENIQFTKNIDITSYVDGKRETHNPEGRAHPHLVWDFYLNGCSIRLLNPQTYMPKLHLLNSTLQEYFNSFVGANAYLTPPDSQGFAPHYDDIEAFILQAEGKKRWRIYKPREENEILPRVSSKNFEQEEIGKPIMEVTLEAGDMLYFPRGYIHQGITIDGEHSLHVTVSMYQKHSWADLLEKLVPGALQIAINENVEFRRGLPFDLYDNFGLVHGNEITPQREKIEKIIKSFIDKIKDHLPINEAVDQMSINYQHDALPPVLSDMEQAVTVHGDTDVMIENGKVVNRVEIGLDTSIRLLRKNILRMVGEDKIRLYYYAENSLEYHGQELSFIEVEEEFGPAIETLIKAYPNYVEVESLNIPSNTDKVQIADALWSRGLIMTEFPLENIEDD